MRQLRDSEKRRLKSPFPFFPDKNPPSSTTMPLMNTLGTSDSVYSIDISKSLIAFFNIEKFTFCPFIQKHSLAKVSKLWESSSKTNLYSFFVNFFRFCWITGIASSRDTPNILWDMELNKCFLYPPLKKYGLNISDVFTCAIYP